ncbi:MULTISPECIES: CTB family bacteriocin [unclassified Tolypothrix]|uniref:CTB family bacteriocin n=1 Tax=unclassified Tolypothrix TaxID=2649714 RepID=UPI0005EAA7FE|nr:MULTISPECIES: CTB family bacteriocin [unclassified Tolypothrix]BAY93579.1 hypothetical protein NIES3275_56190 [Microchaete diplosiphon NIES-3275]EKE99636.1 hypothetical protein FDUTEX481_09898 [Tolypothrix sp. PCC 7601]MBE9082402.1 CTB family bacteriocin [Tolypothrix sp. LEGE 11397]UYD27406.1 CTB family bacteriocin [Tolypothrix sp. PCC 7712]UYD36729.1 CTB family bacteriocin [Tolypothrix sp. PCC 7601]
MSNELFIEVSIEEQEIVAGGAEGLSLSFTSLKELALATTSTSTLAGTTTGSLATSSDFLTGGITAIKIP